MTDRTIRGRVLHAGSATATVIRLDEPLSFWGGLDPASGRVIDRAHPQADASMTGMAVVLTASRGSSGTPGVLAESLRRGTGPAALIVQQADVNLTAGAVVAQALYDCVCPIVQLDAVAFAEVGRWRGVTVASDGAITPLDEPTVPT